MTLLKNSLVGIFLTWVTCLLFKYFPFSPPDFEWWYLPDLITIVIVWILTFTYTNDGDFRKKKI